MFRLFLMSVTLVAGLLSAPASAEFVKTDWVSAGDKKAVLDRSTGLEWLSLNETRGKSIAEVKVLLSTTLSGWRLPTQAEVSQMLTNFFEPYFPINGKAWDLLKGRYTSNDFGLRTSAFSFNSQWNALFGYAYSASGSYRDYMSQAMYVDDGGNVRSGGVHRQLHTSTGYHSHVIDTQRYISASTTYKASTCSNSTNCLSVFLVSDGGTTLSSQLDPSLNINNPNAPVNQVDVSVSAGFSAFGMLFMLMVRRRKRCTAV